MKGERLPKITIALLAIHLGQKKSRSSPKGVRRDHKDEFKGDWDFLGGVKGETLNRFQRRSAVCRCVGLRWLGAAVSR